MVNSCSSEELALLTNLIHAHQLQLNSRIDFISNLPCELCLSILDWLSVKDLYTCSAVSRAWRETLSTNPESSLPLWSHKVKEMDPSSLLLSRKYYPDSSDSSGRWIGAARRQLANLTILDARLSTFTPLTISTLDLPGTVTEIKLQGNFMALALREDKSVHFYELNANQYHWQLRWRSLPGLFVVSCISFKVQKRSRTVAGFVDLKHWSPTSPTSPSSIVPHQHEYLFTIVVGGYSGEIAIMNPFTGEDEDDLEQRPTLLRFQGHVNSVLCCCIKGELLFTGSADVRQQHE